MQVVILAGGLATRMRPRTLTTPKFLLPVAGRPFGGWLLDRLATAGYRDVVLCIAHLGEMVRDFVGDGGAFGLRVRYADEGPDLLGTAGALRNALSELAPTFLVTYGDAYLPFDYGAPLRVLEACSDADGVMAVFRNRGRWDKSNTQLRGTEDDLWVARYDKGSDDPALDSIDYGATALRREIIAEVPPRTPWGLDRIQKELAGKGRLRAFLAHARFFEVGSPGGLDELERELSGPSAPFPSPDGKTK
jgi:N-acetyl-alpha-D-muramate 1-phosphate uridylyltransferase